MVIDKNGITAILRSSEEDVRNHSNNNEDSILITTSCGDFSKSQIGNDSIDLRIAQTGYVLSNDYEYINTLSGENFERYFQKVELRTDKGYDLKPGEILFIGTLERIQLVGDLIGRVSGRSTFARFGLSVHCTQDKFSSGINSIAALQIKNNSNTVLKIFPYQKLAQLIIEKTSPNENPYKGSYSVENEYKLPVIKDSDRAQYDSRTEEGILRLQPRKRTFLKRCNKSAKIISLIQSIFGFMISTGIGIFGCMTEKNWRTGIIIFLAIIYIMMSFFFYVVSTKTESED